MVNQISAAENLTIESDDTFWRLLVHNEAGQRTEILRAAPGEPLIFSSDFALTRRLPSIGRLPAKYVRQVVLGWSHEDDAWHLGLLLARDIADIRGSRWCEIANWPDPDPIVFAELARQSGEALANLLDIPFNIVQPRAGAEGQSQAIERPLPELPIDLGTWRLEDNTTQLTFVRSRKWFFSRYGRIAWYSLLAIVYIVLSVTTLENNLALPNSGVMLPSPELLPYLGIVAALASLVVVLYTAIEILRVPNQIVVDDSAITALKGKSKRWQKPIDNVEAVYVTHVLKRRRQRAMVDHGEINLFKHNGSFDRLIEQAQRDNEEMPSIDDAVTPLTVDDNLTDLQKAGLHLAKAMGDKPIWYDQREK
jgi:hypothetical protein